MLVQMVSISLSGLCVTCIIIGLVWFMVFNVTFNNNSVIPWRSVLLVEETRVPGQNHRPVTSHWQTWSHYAVSSTPRLSRIQTHNVRLFSSFRTNLLLWVFLVLVQIKWYIKMFCMRANRVKNWSVKTMKRYVM
jgi:hypothetical protein